jgi:hypothetical protein
MMGYFNNKNRSVMSYLGISTNHYYYFLLCSQDEPFEYALGNGTSWNNTCNISSIGDGSDKFLYCLSDIRCVRK